MQNSPKTKADVEARAERRERLLINIATAMIVGFVLAVCAGLYHS